MTLSLPGYRKFQIRHQKSKMQNWNFDFQKVYRCSELGTEAGAERRFLICDVNWICNEPGGFHRLYLDNFWLFSVAFPLCFERFLKVERHISLKSDIRLSTRTSCQTNRPRTQIQPCICKRPYPTDWKSVLSTMINYSTKAELKQSLPT